MGIFKNFTKALKKAAPMIGAGIGMYFGGPMGASIGSGIGSLASGRSTEEALMNAALAGGTTYAMGGKDFGKGFNFSTADSPLSGLFGSNAAPNSMFSNDAIAPTQIQSVGSGGSGIMDVLKRQPGTVLTHLQRDAFEVDEVVVVLGLLERRGHLPRNDSE